MKYNHAIVTITTYYSSTHDDVVFLAVAVASGGVVVSTYLLYVLNIMIVIAYAAR